MKISFADTVFFRIVYNFKRVSLLYYNAFINKYEMVAYVAGKSHFVGYNYHSHLFFGQFFDYGKDFAGKHSL